MPFLHDRTSRGVSLPESAKVGAILFEKKNMSKRDVSINIGRKITTFNSSSLYKLYMVLCKSYEGRDMVV